MNEAAVPEHKYSGAKALILLHERHLRACLETWKRARAAGATLPKSDDPDYASLDALLFHVLACARSYMVWMCEVLELPAPDIAPPPEVKDIAHQADAYLEQVVTGWRTPLAGVEEPRFHRPAHLSRWKVEYCVDAMLEHAVMHAVRHEFQLQRLMGGTDR